jgi:hypothetical protein
MAIEAAGARERGGSQGRGDGSHGAGLREGRRWPGGEGLVRVSSQGDGTLASTLQAYNGARWADW